ncbi:hypothetical protein FO519_002011 [Halicephalobus sp. NKZ332]|nr:hypothetical protein FO519_002011 [Halicephalobus sp. NKZ332]
MPVLFNKRRRLPTSSSQSHFPGQQSASSLGGPQSFHRVDSSSSKKTFHSAASGGTATIFQRAQSAGLRSVSSSLKPKEIKGFWNKLKASVKDFYKRRHIKYLLPLVGVMIYMLVGAVIFHWLESDADEERSLTKTKAYQRERLLLVKRMEEIIQDRAAQNDQKRKVFIEEAVDNFHKELSVDFNLEPEWTFMAAMYFSGTLFTTIGYGDIACTTAMGRIVTVVYGLIGIPIMLMTLNHLGKFLFKTITEFLDYCTRKFESLKKLKKKKQDQVAIMEQGEAASVNSKNINTTSEKNRRVSFNLRTGSEDGTLDQLSLDLEAGATQGEPSDDAVFNDDEVIIQEEIKENEMIEQHDPQNMPVTVALFITIGWIFFCAALFKMWEDWTYAESWYFMFISMSTIGLGDVAVHRRDMMVLCFVFVIIGLSLVSMCINVIQQALEDLYKRLLMKLLMDYQASLQKDGDHKGASMGMMQMWGHSKTAKYLMPMLSADTRRHVMTQIQEEAKEKGVELPPIFEDLDEKTGMPKILAVAAEMTESDEPEKLSMIVNDIVRQSDPTRTSIPSRSPLPTVVYYEAHTQTDSVSLEENCSQTTTATLEDSGIQTDSTGTASSQSQEIQTDCPEGITMESQTDRVHTAEQMLQTQIVDYLENEVQTDIHEFRSEKSQTDTVEYDDAAIQTEHRTESPTKGHSPSKGVKRRIRRIRRRRSSRRRNSQGDALNKEQEDSDNSGGSYESLDWDPVDGLHAEKQKPVSDLRRLFDTFKSQK